ncbi:MAG TPA: 16S rRNA (guanine(966)-N(2))-methyltransferase RsmD [Luteimonas sp.]|nr:16S rRNA (guanine(966)-N(2))-methyltransferase RsmD [Luteimonas sp.]
MSRSAGAGTGSVRIIGGNWRGTRLPVADVPGLRPTSDRARETLFNWLAPLLPGARVLDLYAGTGVLGLEALSRGAAEALFVERDPAVAMAIEGACERLGAGTQAHVVRADALKLLALPAHGRFDIVFLDPPFAADAWAPTLAALPPWLTPGAWLYLEAPAARTGGAGAGWLLHREASSRDVRQGLYRRAPTPTPVPPRP